MLRLLLQGLYMVSSQAASAWKAAMLLGMQSPIPLPQERGATHSGAVCTAISKDCMYAAGASPAAITGQESLLQLSWHGAVHVLQLLRCPDGAVRHWQCKRSPVWLVPGRHISCGWHSHWLVGMVSLNHNCLPSILRDRLYLPVVSGAAPCNSFFVR